VAEFRALVGYTIYPYKMSAAKGRSMILEGRKEGATAE